MSAATKPTPRQPWLTLPGFMPDAVGFAVRTTSALLLAYGVAFWMQLEAASSAGVCVAIVAQATPGMAMSKALYRIAGTLIGGVVALLVVSLFGQDRTMLLAAFTVWLGACTFVASLLRDFRAYGAVLSGYTVGIIAISEIDAPSGALEATLNRVAAILLGVASVALVDRLLARQVAFETLVNGLRTRLADVNALAAGALGGHVPDDVAYIHQGAAVLALRSDASYAAVELPDGRQRGTGARSGIAALLGMLAASRALGRGLAVASAEEKKLTVVRPATPRQAFLVERAADLRQQQELARQGLETLERGTRATRRVRLRRHYDLGGAARNAARTVVAVGLCCAFCVYAGWSGATLLLIQQAAFTALLGMAVNPTAAASAMAYALPPAAAMAGIVGYLLLPTVSGFVPFGIAVGGTAFVASLAARHPATARFGPGLLLFFVLILAPSNPQTYDLSGYFNTTLSQVVALLFMILAFQVILPVSPRRRRMRVAAAIWDNLRRTLILKLGHGGDFDQTALQSLHYDQLAQAEIWLERPTPARLAVLARLYAFAELDTALRRARSGLDELEQATPKLAPLTEAARDSLRRLQPPALLATAQELLDNQMSVADSDALLRAVSGMYGVEFLLRRQLRALRRYGVLDPA